MSDLLHPALTPHLAALTLLLGYAAWRDVATRTIPDSISITLIALGACVRLMSGWEALGWSLLVAVSVFFVLLPLCGRGVLGGADLKLLAALAVGFSPETSLHLLLSVTVVGGFLAAAYLLLGRIFRLIGFFSRARMRPRSLPGRIALVECWRIRRHAPLPYGVAIAVGAVFVILQNRGM